MKILCVDDSTLQNNKLVNFLKSLGYSVKKASDGVEALSLLGETYLPDILITDLLMPKMGGLALLEELKEKGIVIPTIVLSTHFHEEMKGLGVISFLQKPYQLDDLRKSLKKAQN